MGFCAANNITLTPPNGYNANNFAWETYLRDTTSIPAGEHLFHRDVPNHGFEVKIIFKSLLIEIYFQEYVS